MAGRTEGGGLLDGSIMNDGSLMAGPLWKTNQAIRNQAAAPGGWEKAKKNNRKVRWVDESPFLELQRLHI